MFLADGSCLVNIVDHGIGMTAQKIGEENQRLVERERLELAPTSVLGLFVVGRLARRHDLGVELLATPTTGGVTARLTIPSALFSHRAGLRLRTRAGDPGAGRPRGRPAEAVAVAATVSTFGRFAAGRAALAGDPGAARAPATASAGSTSWNRCGRTTRRLRPRRAPKPERARRRVRGAQLPSPGTTAPVAAGAAARPGSDQGRDGRVPERLRQGRRGHRGDGASLPGRVPGGSAMACQAPCPRGIRRMPANPLAHPRRPAVTGRPGPPGPRCPARPRPASADAAGRPAARAVVNRPRRDPAAERAAFDSFAAGLAKADVVTADSPPQGVVAGRVMERGEESRK